ncbi:hypothetical protein LXA43DRAFT_1112257 [Ganoderma leucocontextum]|nr:hypothetical protein LXA43DRAFT_1112257 [Ganoderma leucocontextum]
MITGINDDDKLPPFPRDSKAPLDTPPAYSERPAPAPREAYPSPAPSTPSFASSSMQGAPQQFTHAPHAPPPPLTPLTPPSPPPRATDASSYQGSTKSKSGGAGGKFVKAVGQGMFALVAMPVVATAAALYGSGKLVEGIGRGLSAGPEAVLKAYKKMDGKIKGEAPAAGEDPSQGAGQQWHEHEHEHQYQQGETVQTEVVPPTVEESPGLMKRSLQMPMRGSLMEDPSIGMDGGSGSMRANK